MSGVFQKALQLVIGTEPISKPMSSSPHSVNIMPKKMTHRKLTERELIQRESEIGSMIFGEPPRGCQRDFFNGTKRILIMQLGKRHLLLFGMKCIKMVSSRFKKVLDIAF